MNNVLGRLEAALDACDADLAALEKRAAELLTHNARHMLFELCEPDFAWGHPEHEYLKLDPWHDRDAKLELVDADMIEYGEPTGLDGLGGRTLTITKWGRAVSAHCLPLLLAARGATENCPSHPPHDTGPTEARATPDSVVAIKASTDNSTDAEG